MRLSVAIVGLLLFASPALAVDLLPGDVIVLDPSRDTIVHVDLLRIDLATGIGTRASDGGDLLIPSGLAVVLPEPQPGPASAASLLALAVITRVRSARSRRCWTRDGKPALG